MDFDDYNAEMEKYCQEAEEAEKEAKVTVVNDDGEKVYLDDYNAGLERYCRDAAATAKSIDITPAEETEAASKYDSTFLYRVGEIVEVKDFCENRWEECAAGIHFFINRKEAVLYNL